MKDNVKSEKPTLTFERFFVKRAYDYYSEFREWVDFTEFLQTNGKSKSMQFYTVIVWYYAQRTANLA